MDRPAAPGRAFRAWLALLALLVPSEHRRPWRREWWAELSSTDHLLDRARLAAGALPDALWHLLDDWSFDTMFSDLIHALRALRRRVSVTFLAVFVLGLGLGATVVVVSVVDAVLLRPLPFEEPERLVEIWEKNPTKGWDRNVVAPANFLDWQASAATFESMAMYTDWAENHGILEQGDAPPRPIDVVAIGPGFFETLGLSMFLGETFTEDDQWQRSEPRAILSHQLWRDAFGADPDVVGRIVHVEGREVRVHGVAPPDLDYPRAADMWAPLHWDEAAREQVWFRRAHFVRVVGRLAPGASIDDARAELATVAARLETEYPETNTDMGTGVTSLHEWVVGDTRHPLALVAIAVGLLLLVACANVASLMLLRAGARAREMAVRQALGAARRRLVRLLAMEGLLLAAAASLLGLTIARLALRALHLLPVDVPRLDQATLDPRTLIAAFGLAVVATLGFSIAPALLGSRVDLRSALHRGGRHSEGRGHVRSRKALVVAEVALAVLLVIGAGLFVRSLRSLYDVDPGFRAEGVLTVRLNAPGARYQDAEQVGALFEQIAERAAALPGVVAVGQGRTLPIGGGTWTSDYSLQGLERYGVETQHLEVDAGYSEALELRLLAGRFLAAADRADAEPVVLVSRELVRQILPAEDDPAAILGRRICTGKTCTDEDRPGTIVGVVEDTRFDGLAQPQRPMVYHALAQRPQRSRELLLRVDGDDPEALAALVGPLGDAVRAVDPGLPLMKVRTLEEVIDQSLARERFLTLLLTGFGVLALVLALVGTYGVLATQVTLRRREIGIRAALGAGRRGLEGWVVRQGATLLAVGAALGLGLAVLAGRWIEGQLHGIEGTDPATFAAAALLLVTTGLVATWLPARAAARVDPVTALRDE